VAGRDWKNGVDNLEDDPMMNPQVILIKINIRMEWQSTIIKDTQKKITHIILCIPLPRQNNTFLKFVFHGNHWGESFLQNGNLPVQSIAFFEDRHTRNRIKLNTQRHKYTLVVHYVINYFLGGLLDIRWRRRLSRKWIPVQLLKTSWTDNLSMTKQQKNLFTLGFNSLYTMPELDHIEDEIPHNEGTTTEGGTTPSIVAQMSWS
jgi:hypothetical protein